MTRLNFILLALAACCMSFSYGYSISPECRPAPKAETMLYHGVAFPFIKLSQVQK